METKYISKNGLNEWFSQIVISGKRVYAPVEERGKVEFKKVQALSEVAEEYIQTTQSIKSAVFPRAEILFSYEKENGKIKVEDFNPMQQDSNH